MNDARKRVILRVLESMQENLGEQLTVDDMARTVSYSKFHFSHLVQRVTGLPLGKFLSRFGSARSSDCSPQHH
ncbi:AraC family transcriptional regulator [Nonomuraea ceibae]|uniref:AraC family transcriptional regulator n=1 Tax=Nonomuraea ceibae TaxID=1935170 RepID=UPI001C5EDA0E|nr:AraC family transcriptional regulator [Nonomuraea ceibae]